MTQIPPLSVIIPHLNDEKGLAHCLMLLNREAEDVPGLEVIVVDNGSRTLPEDLVAKHGAQLLTEATPGPGPARTTGAKAAKASILAFIDSDCFAEPGWARVIVDHFAKPDAAPVIGGFVGIAYREPGRPDMIEAFEAVFNYRMKLYIETQNFSGTGNLATRADVFADVGGFAGINVAEDRDWGRRATAKGYKIAYVENMRVITPARENFASQWSRVDRMIAHDFSDMRPGLGGKARWCLKALALIASPVAEIPKIATSPNLSGLRARVMSFLGMTRVRFYRGFAMLKLMLTSRPGAKSEIWNRE